MEDVAPVDAMAVVSDAKETVDGAVADPKGVVASTVEQVSRTVDEVAGDATVDKVLELSPVGKAPPGVADTAKPIASTVQAPDASGSEAVGPAPSRQQPESVQPLVSQAQNSLETGAATEPARLAWRANPPRIAIRATVTSPGNSVQRPLPTRTGLPPPLATWDDAFGSPELTASHDASSVVSEAPLTPPAPGDQPATAASVVGAAGAALLAALFSAFLFLAPRRRRSIRPGPILVWPDPCLSLAERPG